MTDNGIPLKLNIMQIVPMVQLVGDSVLGWCLIRHNGFKVEYILCSDRLFVPSVNGFTIIFGYSKNLIISPFTLVSSQCFSNSLCIVYCSTTVFCGRTFIIILRTHNATVGEVPIFCPAMNLFYKDMRVG